MRNSYTLGRISGIEIGINWSVLALLALLMWTLATGIFPETNPGLSDNAYFAMAVIASLGFFASILLHELGHALQARRDGVPIDGITLWLFGGVARFKGMFPSAGAEFRIAVAGPLVSLVLAGALIGGALLGLPPAVDGVSAWLGFINVALLVFNLIPALPLDGGRMLRAAIWQWRGDLRTATNVAAGAGRVLAIAMIAGGIVMTVAFDGGISGIWLALIGWFVLQAAGAEARYVSIPAESLRVDQMMAADPVTLSPAQTLGEVSDEVLWRSRQPAYPVVREAEMVGLLPATALEVVPRAAWGDTRVGDVMEPLDDIPSVAPGDGIQTALQTLASSGRQWALVLDGGRVVGLLTAGDILRAVGAGDEATPA